MKSKILYHQLAAQEEKSESLKKSMYQYVQRYPIFGHFFFHNVNLFFGFMLPDVVYRYALGIGMHACIGTGLCVQKIISIASISSPTVPSLGIIVNKVLTIPSPQTPQILLFVVCRKFECKTSCLLCVFLLFWWILIRL